MVVLFFFFSSRRRHTRSLCDWSSDVCSSDLGAMNCIGTIAGFHEALNQFQRAAIVPMQFIAPVPRLFLEERLNLEIGRASCRERVYICVGAGAAKKKTDDTMQRRRRYGLD